MALAAVEAFDRAWHERPPYGEAYHLARFLSHLAKNRTAEHSAEITRLAMELFGGWASWRSTPWPAGTGSP